MAITSLKVDNFKCFLHSSTVPITPLTLIFGRNNAGKSTLIQTLLLLRQTLDARGPGLRLNLRGPLFSAGNFADIVHDHRTKRTITLTLGVSAARSLAGDVAFEYSSDEPRPPRLVALTVTHRHLPTLEVRRGRGQGGPYELHIDGTRIGLEEEANFFMPAGGLFPLIGSESPKKDVPNTRYSDARRFARVLLRTLEGDLSKLRALGPFRAAPKRRYEYAGFLRDTIDVEGQSVVDALIDSISRRGKLRGRLVADVNSWLRTVGNVQLMPIRLIAKSERIYELRLRSMKSGRWANFADVGSGIGQAFPVLVEGLRTPRDGMFLVQEPEIHLHPDAQLAIGDFLLDLARHGRTVVAETHSEHVLLRVRRRALEKRINPKNLTILHVGVDSSGTSVVRQVGIDRLAQLSDWPTGFMEEATTERISLLKEMAGK